MKKPFSYRVVHNMLLQSITKFKVFTFNKVNEQIYLRIKKKFSITNKTTECCKEVKFGMILKYFFTLKLYVYLALENNILLF